MYPTTDAILDAVRSSVSLMLLYVADGIPMTREPSKNKDWELLIWRRRNKLRTLDSLKTGNRNKGKEQRPSLSLMTAASG